MPDYREVSHALNDLMVVVALMDANIAAHEEYQPAREGWEERKQEIIDWSERQIHDVTDFGEAFDADEGDL